MNCTALLLNFKEGKKSSKGSWPGSQEEQGSESSQERASYISSGPTWRHKHTATHTKHEHF